MPEAHLPLGRNRQPETNYFPLLESNPCAHSMKKTNDHDKHFRHRREHHHRYRYDKQYPQRPILQQLPHTFFSPFSSCM